MAKPDNKDGPEEPALNVPGRERKCRLCGKDMAPKGGPVTAAHVASHCQSPTCDWCQSCSADRLAPRK